jgi:anti-anti-sigma regulatory factor
MAFSFFKKPEEKMPPSKAARPAATPQAPPPNNPGAKPAVVGARPPAAAAKAPASPSTPPNVKPAAPPPPSPAVEDDLESLDFTGIQLEEENDPVDATAEEAAIAFANEDEAQALTILKEGVKNFSSVQGVPGTETLWLMLFDLYRLTGQHEPFMAMELEYAKRYEKQPPVWRQAAPDVAAGGAASGAILFKGDLVAANSSGFELAGQALAKAEKLRLDVGKVKVVDAGGAAQLIELLQRAKKAKKPIEMMGMDSLVKLLEPPVKAGDRAQALWQLLLECYQRQGKQAVFDELAFEFAVTFEISPPAYEAPSVAKKPASAAKPAERPADDALHLVGELRGGGRIDGLEDYLKLGHKRAIIDMSGVTRLDFAAAGVLFTTLQPTCKGGVSVVIRHPNYLVAALLRVVGLADAATVIDAKH